MNITIIDNYDSFTYNLVHAIEHIAQQTITVHRNDEVSLETLQQYSHIILSPGPGIPSEAGLLLDIIKTFAPTKKRYYHPHPIYDNYGDSIPQNEAHNKLNLDKNYKYLLFFGFIRAYKGLDLLDRKSVV